jgi:hypothetical protein
MQMQSSCLALYSVGYEGNDRENVVVLDNVFLLLFKVQSQGWNIKKKKKKKKKSYEAVYTIPICFPQIDQHCLERLLYSLPPFSHSSSAPPPALQE